LGLAILLENLYYFVIYSISLNPLIVVYY
jgi:hypothetical protein